jgi:hypothetical protein
MNSEPDDEIFKAWYAAVKSKDLRRALQIAADAYQCSANSKNAEVRLQYERLLRLSADLDVSGRTGGDELITVCSFCCEPLEAKKVVRGPRSAICETCIELAVNLVGE